MLLEISGEITPERMINKSKVSRRKEIVKIKVEINKD